MSPLPAEPGRQELRPAPEGENDPIQEAIRAFQAGADRERSFQVLFRRYHPAIRRFFARRGARPEECLDLTQEVFLGVYRGLETYRPEARFETWLYRIATTTYLKRLRSQSTAKRKGEEVATEEVEGFEPALAAGGAQLEELLEGEQKLALRRAVAELPDQMRRCLLLRIQQEMKYREIATLQRISIQTVKAHLFQAKKRLRQHLRALGRDGAEW